MGRPAGWMTELTGRAPMKSPGKPSLRCDVERLFWHEIAKGLSSEEAALAAGAFASGWQPMVSRAWRNGHVHDQAAIGSVPVLRGARGDRAVRAQGTGVREIARRLGRSASTISRELRRNAATRGGKLEYRASVAQWKAERDGPPPEGREARC